MFKYYMCLCLVTSITWSYKTHLKHLLPKEKEEKGAGAAAVLNTFLRDLGVTTGRVHRGIESHAFPLLLSFISSTRLVILVGDCPLIFPSYFTSHSFCFISGRIRT